MITLLARNRKHYLVEVVDKNLINEENEKNQKDEENVFNHKNKNIEEGKSVKPRKDFKFRYLITNIRIWYIPYGQSSAKLSVTRSLGHSVTWSLGHSVTRSLGHSVT